MAVSAYDKAVRSDYIPLPMEQLFGAGQMMQNNVSAANELTGAVEGLLGEVNALDPDAGIRQELIGGYENEISGLADEFNKNPMLALQKARQLKRKFGKDMSTGQLGAIQGRYDHVQQQLAHYDEMYKDNPEMQSYVRSVLEVPELQYDASTGTYNKPNFAPHLGQFMPVLDNKELSGTIDKIVGNIQDTDLNRLGISRLGSLDELTSMYMTGKIEGRQYDDVLQIIANQIPTEYLDQMAQAAVARGDMDYEEQRRLFKKSTDKSGKEVYTPNEKSDIMRQVMGAAQGRAREDMDARYIKDDNEMALARYKDQLTRIGKGSVQYGRGPGFQFTSPEKSQTVANKYEDLGGRITAAKNRVDILANDPTTDPGVLAAERRGLERLERSKENMDRKIKSISIAQDQKMLDPEDQALLQKYEGLYDPYTFNSNTEAPGAGSMAYLFGSGEKQRVGSMNEEFFNTIPADEQWVRSEDGGVFGIGAGDDNIEINVATGEMRDKRTGQSLGRRDEPVNESEKYSAIAKHFGVSRDQLREDQERIKQLERTRAQNLGKQLEETPAITFSPLAANSLASGEYDTPTGSRQQVMNKDMNEQQLVGWSTIDGLPAAEYVREQLDIGADIQFEIKSEVGLDVDPATGMPVNPVTVYVEGKEPMHIVVTQGYESIGEEMQTAANMLDDAQARGNRHDVAMAHRKIAGLAYGMDLAKADIMNNTAGGGTVDIPEFTDPSTGNDVYVKRAGQGFKLYSKDSNGKEVPLLENSEPAADQQQLSAQLYAVEAGHRAAEAAYNAQLAKNPNDADAAIQAASAAFVQERNSLLQIIPKD